MLTVHIYTIKILLAKFGKIGLLDFAVTGAALKTIILGVISIFIIGRL